MQKLAGWAVFFPTHRIKPRWMGHPDVDGEQMQKLAGLTVFFPTHRMKPRWMGHPDVWVGVEKRHKANANAKMQMRGFFAALRMTERNVFGRWRVFTLDRRDPGDRNQHELH